MIDINNETELSESENLSDERMAETLQSLGYRLKRLAQEQIGIRQQKEDQWLHDLEQVMGRYDTETLARLSRGSGSQAFVNITRPKTMAAIARLTEMAFPSSESSFSKGLQPTPIPDLQKKLLDQSIIGLANDGTQITVAKIAEEQIKEAKEKCLAMAKEIDDQLVESLYSDVAKDVICDACTYGTGIIKGPVIVNKTNKRWRKISGSVHSLEIISEFKPAVEHVKIWDYFPDMSATKLSDCEFEFERKFVTKKQLRELAKRPGYLKNEIKRSVTRQFIS